MDLRPGERSSSTADLFLPAGYRENEVDPRDPDRTRYWAHPELAAVPRKAFRDPVYRLAARIARRRRPAAIIDLGCGTGHELVARMGGLAPVVVGVDLPRAIQLARQAFPEGTWLEGDVGSEKLWSALGGLHPELVVCADVIEHLEDPRALLSQLVVILGDTGGVGVVSTPDRSRLERATALGPPKNPRHVREWAFPEMLRLLTSMGLRVLKTSHVLPRRYPLTSTELRRLLYRAAHRRAIPDRRTSMAFVVAARDG